MLTPVTVARETILQALEDVEALEEITLRNLEGLIAECLVDRGPGLKKLAIPLLRELKEDGGRHREMVQRVMERLSHGLYK